MTTFNASNAQCYVLTYKEGLLSVVAHDLKIGVTSFEVKAEGGVVTGTFDARSLRVIAAMKDGQEAASSLSEKDRADVEQNIVKDVLDAKKHGQIQFSSTSLEKSGAGWRVRGNLTIKGNTKAVVFTATQSGDRVVAEVPINQLDYGVKPYSAMLGTLKIKPEIKVVISLPGSVVG